MNIITDVGKFSKDGTFTFTTSFVHINKDDEIYGQMRYLSIPPLFLALRDMMENFRKMIYLSLLPLFYEH